MPSVLCHLLLARDVLERAARDGQHSWLCSHRDSFIAGGWGPDLGVFPGTVPLLTDCAHYILSGQLGRKMWQVAHTDAERAFAAGWCLHILADAMLHPLINAAAGEAVHGDRNQRCTWGDSPAWHQRIEIGLDGYQWVERCGDEVPRLTTQKVIQLAERMISAAYRECYPGCRFLDRQFSTTVQNGYRGVARLANFSIIDGHRLYGRRLPVSLWGSWLFPYGLIRLATALLGERFRFFALGQTTRPDSWLCDAYAARVDELIPRFFNELEGLFSRLPDYNLDTGDKSAESQVDESYRGAIRAREQLVELGWAGM